MLAAAGVLVLAILLWPVTPPSPTTVALSTGDPFAISGALFGNTEKPLVSMEDYQELVNEVANHRIERLVRLDEFLQMAQEPNTIILDTRSDKFYRTKHLKGAKHLAFTEFTQANLQRLIPDPETRILIYCNNNFAGDPIALASKMYNPALAPMIAINADRKPVLLALNIPTYINLYGYGYRNVYELGELVSTNDRRIELVASPPPTAMAGRIGLNF